MWLDLPLLKIDFVQTQWCDEIQIEMENCFRCHIFSVSLEENVFVGGEVF